MTQKARLPAAISLWDQFGALPTFIAGVVFSAVALVAILVRPRRQPPCVPA